MPESPQSELLSEDDHQGLKDFAELNRDLGLDLGLRSFLKKTGISEDAFKDACDRSNAPQSSLYVLEFRMVSDEALSSLTLEVRIHLIRILRICTGVTEHDFEGNELETVPSPVESLTELNKRLEAFKAQSGIIDQVVDPEILKKLDFE